MALRRFLVLAVLSLAAAATPPLVVLGPIVAAAKLFPTPPPAPTVIASHGNVGHR